MGLGFRDGTTGIRQNGVISGIWLRAGTRRIPTGEFGNIWQEPADVIPPDSAGSNQIAFLSAHTRFGVPDLGGA